MVVFKCFRGLPLSRGGLVLILASLISRLESKKKKREEGERRRSGDRPEQISFFCHEREQSRISSGRVFESNTISGIDDPIGHQN